MGKEEVFFFGFRRPCTSEGNNCFSKCASCEKKGRLTKGVSPFPNTIIYWFTKFSSKVDYDGIFFERSSSRMGTMQAEPQGLNIYSQHWIAGTSENAIVILDAEGK